MVHHEGMAGAAPHMPWTWRDVGAVVLLLAAGTAALAIFAQAITLLAGLQPGTGLSSPVIFGVGAGFCGLMLLGIHLFAARRSGYAALGWCAAPWRAVAITPLLLLIELIAVGLINSGIAQLTGSPFENPQFDMLTGGRALALPEVLLLLLLVAGLVPLSEELFFRGMIYPLLRQRLSAAAAIAVNAALFAAFHFIPLLFPALFVVGLALAFLREWSGSIMPSILLHAMQNTLAVIAINALLSEGLAGRLAAAVQC